MFFLRSRFYLSSQTVEFSGRFNIAFLVSLVRITALAPFMKESQVLIAFALF